MTAPDDDAFEFSGRVLSAVLEYAGHEWPRLARQVIYRLQRISASGIFSDNFRHRTLWDEYCHEAQSGPHDLLEEAWQVTINSVLAKVVDGLEPHVSEILSIDTELEIDFPSNMIGVRDGLLWALERHVSQIAAARNLERFQNGDR